MTTKPSIQPKKPADTGSDGKKVSSTTNQDGKSPKATEARVRIMPVG